MPVLFHFDFISPYSYVASQLLARPEHAHLELEYTPVVFGTMLSKLGVPGPGEIPARRRAGLQDVLLLCQHYDIDLKGPPTHPFNSLYALRSVCGARPEDRARLTTAYFQAAWGEGRALDDPAVLRDVLARLGVDQDPEAAASDRDNRATLKRNTKALLDAGAWGVPTFLVDDLLFFGHDRIALLEAYLAGGLDRRTEALEEMLTRPQPGRIT